MTQFDMTFTLDESNISTFMEPGWRLLNVKNAKEISREQDCDFFFPVRVDHKVKDKYKEYPSVVRLLERIETECLNETLEFQFRRNAISKNKYSYEELGQTNYRNTMKCKFPPLLHEYMVPLFIASIVNYQEIMKAKGDEKRNLKTSFQNMIENFKNESFTFTLKVENAIATATLTDLDLYKSKGNPFVEYARNSMIQTSVSHVLGKEIFESNKEERIENFYNYDTIKDWQPIELLKEIEVGKCKNVIYMLYDEKADPPRFYVGQALDLRTRLEQHLAKETDPIKNFTHFRYTMLNDSYDNYIYYIENAAIHDCAAILNMPNRKKLKKSLQEYIHSDSVSGSIENVIMVNTAEHQTRKKKKE